MKAKDIREGGIYEVRVSGKLAPVKIIAWYGKRGYGTNLHTMRTLTFKSARRLRRRIPAETREHVWGGVTFIENIY